VKNILAANAPPAPIDIQTISLPANISDAKAADRESAANIQQGIREQFQRLFHQGYIVTGLEPREETTDYILEPAASVAGLRLPEYRPEEFED
jgi:predicted GNAT superfamily acetyltransferase